MKLTKDKSGNNAVIARLTNVREHPNADRLKLATVFGNTVIVGLNNKEGEKVVFFDTNLRLSHNYLSYNNLYSNPDLNQDKTKKGYFSKSGRVKAQRFRGQLSTGFAVELSTLTVPGLVNYNSDVISEDDFEYGNEFTHIDGVEICSKFVNVSKCSTRKNPRKPIKVNPMFKKHFDTKQLMRNIWDIPCEITCYLEEKIHGTSGRTGKVIRKNPWWKFWKPREEWIVMSGTRSQAHINFHMPAIREEIERKLAPHLRKGETVYYEIYGYDGGKEIRTGYPYECRPGEYKVLLYRVTITTPDNYSYDLSREYVYTRAGELGLEKPEILAICQGYNVESMAEKYCQGVSISNESHLKEGLVVWWENRDGTWGALKHKNPEFLLAESRRIDKDGQSDIEDIL